MRTDLILKLRSFNEAFLAGGLGLFLGGALAGLILNTATWWGIGLMILGGVVLALFLAVNLAKVKEVGRKRGTVARANLSLVAVAMLAIVAGLNYVMARHPVRFDLTSNKMFTLSPQTLDTLKGLKQDVRVTMFVSPRRSNSEVMRAQNLLEEYEKRSDKFHFKVVDVDRNPVEAQKMKITEANTVVFLSGENRKDVLQRDYVTYAFTGGRQPEPKFQGEGSFTSALLKMNDATQLTLYFTEGHGEMELENPRPEGMNVLKSALEKQNYSVKSLKLATTGEIPPDAAVIGILGPETAFLKSEVDLLRKHLEKGGKLVACLDPLRDGGLGSLLRDYGIRLGNDLVVDPTSHNFINAQEIIPQYVFHPIVEKLSENRVAVVMPFSRSVLKVEPALSDVTQSPLLQTTDKGWGETDLKTQRAAYDKGIDTEPPVLLAMACERSVEGSEEGKSRLVVFGNSSFLTNQYLGAGGNQDIAVNSFSWAAQVEDKITIHPKEREVRNVQLSKAAENFVYYLTVFILPLSVLAFGVAVWYRRRSM